MPLNKENKQTNLGPFRIISVKNTSNYLTMCKQMINMTLDRNIWLIEIMLNCNTCVLANG